MNESTKEVQAASYAAESIERWDWTAELLAELNAKLDRPFVEVELFNRCLAFALWQSGHPVEWLHNFGPHEQWKNAEPGINLWGRGMRLRILPKPEVLVLPSIDWSHVAAKWKWLTQDEDGQLWLHDRAPDQRRRDWMSDACLTAVYFASAKPGSGDWRRLIVQRPEGV